MTKDIRNMMNLRDATILGRRGTMVGRSVGRSVGWLCEVDKKFIVLCQRSTSRARRGPTVSLEDSSSASSGAPHPRIEAAAQRRIDSGWYGRTPPTDGHRWEQDALLRLAEALPPHHGWFIGCAQRTALQS